MRNDKWVIEKRDEKGQLLFDLPQPEAYFGSGSYTGVTEHEMAMIVFRHSPNASLQGTNIPVWPSYINPRFVARRKTW